MTCDPSGCSDTVTALSGRTTSWEQQLHFAIANKGKGNVVNRCRRTSHLIKQCHNKHGVVTAVGGDIPLTESFPCNTYACFINGDSSLLLDV